MSRLIDFVCHDCQKVLAREHEDGSWSVKVRARVNGRWRTVDIWQERFVCPECKAPGYVNATDSIFMEGRGRIRVPTRPIM